MFVALLSGSCVPDVNRQPFCGLGNWLCDEILFHSRIHPDHPCPLLTEEQLAMIVDKVRYVSFEAVKAEGREERFPKGWLFSSRWGRGRGGDEVILVRLVASRPSVCRAEIGRCSGR